jgi:hypothetical protein
VTLSPKNRADARGGRTGAGHLLAVCLLAVTLGTSGCADEFSLDGADLASGYRLVKPEGWILTVHPEGGYELLHTRSGRVRKIGVHTFPRAQLAAEAGTDDPAAEAFAAAVLERYRERIRAAMAKRRGFPAPLVGYFDAYGDERYAAIVERGQRWSVCHLSRPDGEHPAWYNLHLAVGDVVILVTAFVARADDGTETLSEPELRDLLAALRWEEAAS